MNLKKRIELHFGRSPVRADATERPLGRAMQSSLNEETEFCAVYAKTDVPAGVHNRTNDHMVARFGVHSQFAQEQKSYLRPYTVETSTGLAKLPSGEATKTGKINADTLRESSFRIGGAFFNMDIADQVIREFETLGYEIERKYV